MSNHKFQVNLAGMIKLLSDHLYDTPGVFLRELMQNAIDGISARKEIDSFTDGKVEIELSSDRSSPAITVTDNGIGLTENDVHEFLSTIGSSSKIRRGDQQPFLGRFGVGLLSGFLVADEIVLTTQSMDQTSPAIQWRGRGDGTYDVEQIQSEMPPGTRVVLQSKLASRDWFRRQTVEELAARYGQYLPCKVKFRTGDEAVEITRKPPWRILDTDRDRVTDSRNRLLTEGHRLWGEKFLDAFPIVTQTGGVKGIAYVLPYATTRDVTKSNLIYLRGMFLTEADAGLLPSWAFFVKFVLNIDSLPPTAARDSLVMNDSLVRAKEEITDQVKSYLIDLARRDRDQFNRILNLHYLPMKALAVEDQALYEVLINGLPFESSHGSVTLPNYFASNRKLRYIENYDQYREAEPTALAQNVRVFNAGLAYDRQLIQRYSDLNHDCEVQPFSLEDLVDDFVQLSDEQHNQISFVLEIANETLREFNCRVECRSFSPHDLPAIYSLNAAAQFVRSAERVKRDVDELLGDVLASLTSGEESAGTARLILNFSNPLTKELSLIRDQLLLRRSIEVLYLQTLLLGHHPLSDHERDRLGDSLRNLISLAISGLS